MSLSGQLKRFADGLAPDKTIIKASHRCVGDIRTKLRDYFRNTDTIVHRVRPLGSYGKKTSVYLSMDIDIVVYFNDIEPPFTENGLIHQLEDFVHYFDFAFEHSTNKSVSFRYDSQFSIDLLPATNFIPRNIRGLSDCEKISEQVKAAHIVLRRNPRQYKDLSSSLSEATVSFQKKRNCHTLIRLVKFWRLAHGIRFFACSYIMELLAVSAAEDSRNTRRDIFEEFRAFLKLLKEPARIALYWTDFYERKDIPPDILASPPYLMDPSNPYNNLLNKVIRLKIEEFVVPIACSTLELLDEAGQYGAIDSSKLFFSMHGLKECYKGHNYITDCRRDPTNPMPYYIQHTDNESKFPLKGLVDSLSTCQYAATFKQRCNRNRKRSNWKELTAKIARVVEKFRRSGEDHKMRDVTCFIPSCLNDGDVYCISLNWENRVDETDDEFGTNVPTESRVFIGNARNDIASVVVDSLVEFCTFLFVVAYLAGVIYGFYAIGTFLF